MENQLIGYLLNALDPADQRAVEAELQRTPAARKSLATLRRAIEPLDYDCEDPVAPPRLVEETLKRVAAFKCRPSTTMPLSRDRGSYAPFWRRADVLISACILFLLLAMVPPILAFLKNREQLLACQHNLGQFHAALKRFADDHGGQLPGPQAHGPMAFAGSFAPQLRDAGYWEAGLSLVCPATMRADGAPSCPPPACREFEFPDSHLRRRRASGAYGYSLGVEPESGGPYRSLRLGDGDHLGVMSDQPPRPYEPYRLSPNHGDRGLNVLFLGGHVRYQISRNFNLDDLFLNRHGKMAAGNGLNDTVIGYSEAEPYPPPPCCHPE